MKIEKYFTFSSLLLLVFFPLYLTHQLILIPQTDDPRLGKTRAFLCWERSLHDFSTIFNFSKSVQEKKILRPYTIKGQLDAYEHWLGYSKQEVMPVSYSPVCLYCFGLISSFPVEAAFLLWNLTCALIWLISARILQELFSPIKGILIAAIIVGSSMGYMSIFLGQTALLYCGFLISISLSKFKTSYSKYLFTSFAMCLLFFKPPGALLAIAILLFQNRKKELLISLLIPLGMTALFCQQHGGIQTIWDYLKWIQACNKIDISSHFAGAIQPIFQSNLISFLMSTQLIDLPQILTFNLLCIVMWGVLAVSTIALKKMPLNTTPMWLGWIYILLSPYLGITEDLIAGWILVEWIKRHPKFWAYGLIWLILLLNTSQPYSIIAPSYFYLHPISWPLKLLGFIGWLTTELLEHSSPQLKNRN